MPRNVVVTGGAGFIGRHLVRHLAMLDCRVTVVDDLSAHRDRPTSVPGAAELVVASVREESLMQRVFRDADTVFHLAALPRVQLSIKKPFETHKVNVDGTIAVLEAARHVRVRRVVFASSSSVYGDQATLPLNETMVPNPLSPYAVQKRVGEMYCGMFQQLYGLETVCLRYFNVYGPGYDPEGEYALVIGKFLEQRRRGEPLTICGDGEQTRDFTHVTDVVAATAAAMLCPLGGAPLILNIGAGNPVSINRLAELIGGPSVHVERRHEPRHTFADISRAKARLGWRPRTGIADGIAGLKPVL